MSHFFYRKGQSLFEVIFTLAIAALIMVGIVSLAASSIRNSAFSRNNTQATRYVQEASEWLREQRDTDWSVFSGYASSAPGEKWCLTSLAWPGSSGNCGTTTIDGTFTREVTLELMITSTPDDTVEATIVVGWTDAQGLHEARSVARYTDWK